MAAKRGRQPGFVMSDEHRLKIQNSNILNCLIKHAVGEEEMSQSRVTAALGLMKKVLPDLQAITHGGDPDNPIETITEIRRTFVESAGNQDSAGIPAASKPGEV